MLGSSSTAVTPSGRHLPVFALCLLAASALLSQQASAAAATTVKKTYKPPPPKRRVASPYPATTTATPTNVGPPGFGEFQAISPSIGSKPSVK